MNILKALLDYVTEADYVGTDDNAIILYLDKPNILIMSYCLVSGDFHLFWIPFKALPDI